MKAKLSPKWAKVKAALLKAMTSKEGMKLEFALLRYVAYAVLAALGIHHAGAFGL